MRPDLTHVHRRICNHIMMLYSNKEYATALRQHYNSPLATQTDFLCDITHGEAYKSLLNSAPDGVLIKETDIFMGLSTDGVQPFKYSSRYSVYPVAATIYNFGPDVR